jgi:hypothetical protein
MRRVLAVVEGFTERTVVEQVIAPYLGARQLSIHPKVLGKPGHKGGIRSFDAVAKEILALMRQEATSVVTTFLDFYGLPASWPGLQEAPGKKAIETATSVEKAMALALQEKSPQDIGDLTRVIPYVQMHEIEALLFADVKAMAAVFEGLISNYISRKFFNSVVNARKSTITRTPPRQNVSKQRFPATGKEQASGLTLR